MTLSRVDRLKALARANGVYSGVGIYTHFWNRKCIEPVKRRCGGSGMRWVSHRFEIKGGISWRDAMAMDMAQPNVLFVQLDQQGNSRLTFRGIPVRLVEAA